MEFKEILLYKKFRSYCWNLNRIDEKFKKEFLERFAKEFKDENLKLEIFKHRELRKLKKSSQILTNMLKIYFIVLL
ncbi:hypothetical protein [Campylobacter felis]|uniref:hypothetical protein n=1 Tax=Campylobacter felis TaxID=2974565 RepID=UPI002562873C|nr:hypothetical protein [Campylobacter felis]